MIGSQKSLAWALAKVVPALAAHQNRRSSLISLSSPGLCTLGQGRLHQEGQPHPTRLETRVGASGSPPEQGMSEHLVHIRFFDQLGAGFPERRRAERFSHVVISKAEE